MFHRRAGNRAEGDLLALLAAQFVELGDPGSFVHDHQIAFAYRHS